jgi:hypothetical protein
VRRQDSSGRTGASVADANGPVVGAESSLSQPTALVTGERKAELVLKLVISEDRSACSSLRLSEQE